MCEKGISAALPYSVYSVTYLQYAPSYPEHGALHTPPFDTFLHPKACAPNGAYAQYAIKKSTPCRAAARYASPWVRRVRRSPGDSLRCKPSYATKQKRMALRPSASVDCFQIFLSQCRQTTTGEVPDAGTPTSHTCPPA